MDGYWPVGGCCEQHTEEIGMTVKELFDASDRAKQMIEGFTMMFGAMCGNDFTEYMEKFMQEDCAILKNYGTDIDKLVAEAIKEESGEEHS